ncbi:uncharacterized protein LOC141614248 [Silene latifolia]|uniref:uncharacterized protein LOC141614248 n=1 Tax=Silene latifolia TaxID=37657 RepID=UPI003D77D844
MNKVQAGLGSKWEFVVNNDIIYGGRIWIMWDPSLFTVNVLSKDWQFMYLQVTFLQNGFCWTCSMVYGSNKDTDRCSLWSFLTTLVASVNGHWLVMGDFNNVLYADERIGAKVTDAETKDFQGCVDQCRLYDLLVLSTSYLKAYLITTLVLSACGRMLVAKKLKMLKGPLKKLNKEGFGDILNTAEVARLVLEVKQSRLHLDPHNLLLQLEERAVAHSFKELQDATMSFLGQKAKVIWMTCNDENTHYFHSSIRARRARNKVLSILDMNGHQCSDNDTIEMAFLDYYQKLLGSSERVTRVNCGVVRRGKCVSDLQSLAMVAEVIREEVRTALFSIPNEKAPGPDGYSSSFFKDAFDIIGDDVVGAIL